MKKKQLSNWSPIFSIRCASSLFGLVLSPFRCVVELNGRFDHHDTAHGKLYIHLIEKNLANAIFKLSGGCKSSMSELFILSYIEEWANEPHNSWFIMRHYCLPDSLVHRTEIYRKRERPSRKELKNLRLSQGPSKHQSGAFIYMYIHAIFISYMIYLILLSGGYLPWQRLLEHGHVHIYTNDKVYNVQLLQIFASFVLSWWHNDIFLLCRKSDGLIVMRLTHVSESIRIITSMIILSNCYRAIFSWFIFTVLFAAVFQLS